MSEPKFTKGPYYLDPYDCYSVKGNATGSKKRDGDELRECVLCTFNGSLKQTEANIALYLAAPEMYELLQDIATNYQCMPNPYGVEQRIEAVLKKARGEK